MQIGGGPLLSDLKCAGLIGLESTGLRHPHQTPAGVHLHVEELRRSPHPDVDVVDRALAVPHRNGSQVVGVQRGAVVLDEAGDLLEFEELGGGESEEELEEDEHAASSLLSIMMKNIVYLRSGDLVTISHEMSCLSVQLLTQSVPAMHSTLPNPFTSYFLLTTQKCLEKAAAEDRPLEHYQDDQICYGESVIFVHLLSGKFLSYSKDMEARSTLELVGTFRDCCKFTIRPIFRCQTVVTRRIRNQESVIFSPSELYNREGSISLCIQKNDGRKDARSHVMMKKNEFSQFLLSRKKSPSIEAAAVTNLQILQLSNIETRKNLYMSVSQTKHRDIVTFEKHINEHESYFDLRPVDMPHSHPMGEPETRINYQSRFYIHSWGHNKYLSINMIGDICLMEAPSQDAEFFIEAYNDDDLKLGSAVRIRHASTQKYLSLSATSSEIEMIKESRLIDTFQLVKVPVEELRLNVFVNDAHDILLKEMTEGRFNYRHKRNIQKVLKELTSFIYGEEVSLTEFLSMKTDLPCRLSTFDQKLLAEVGIINTLVKLSRIFIEEATREVEGADLEQRDHTEEMNIIAHIMMSIVGVCLRNPSNTKIFVQEMPLLYECIGSVSGIVECFYHLFKNSKELLLILENTSHRVEKKELASIELLIHHIGAHTFDFAMRGKIMKLMEALICLSQGEKILLHEAYLLISMEKQKLNNVLLSLKPSDHHDLLIYLPQKQKFEELDAMLEMKRTYEKELGLVKEQLILLCSLSLNSTSEAFSYVSSIISEEMILRYLKTNLHPEFKEIFMRLLLDVYLSDLKLRKHSTSKCFVLSNRAPSEESKFSKVEETSLRSRLIEDGEQMSDITSSFSHSKTIEKIQNLILEGTKKAILNEIIDSSFYMNIKALRKFLQLRILDQQEVVEFRSLLVEFIGRYSKQSFKEEEKKKIVLEILNIIADYFSHEMENLTRSFVHVLKVESIAPEKLFPRFQSFVDESPFFSEQAAQDMSFVADLIRQSIVHEDKDILLASSDLMQTINSRHRMFVRELKDKIILDSNWSIGLFNRVSHAKRSLSKEIHEFMSNQGDKKKLEAIQGQLNQLISQLNYLYYENPGGSTQFSSLTQNVYREMGLLEDLVSFLNDSQKKFKEVKKNSKVDIFAACFEFISMYLKDNETNFFQFRQKYLDIKFVFEYPDRGQVKFLNHLVKMPRAREIMLDEINDCLLMSFQNNPEPNPFTILTLYNVLCFPHVDKANVDNLVEYLANNPSTMLWILKVSERRNSCQFMWSYDPDKPNYHKDWLIYLVVLLNLLLVILEHSTERTAISLEIKKHLSLSQLLQLLEVKDLISNSSLESLEGSLIKKQAMKIFNKLYMNELNQNSSQVEKVLALVQNIFQGLTYLREDVMGSNNLLIEGVLAKGSDHESIIYEVEVQSQNHSSSKSFELTFNQVYMGIVVYYPFIIKVLEAVANPSLLGESTSSTRKEVEILQDSIYRKFKDFIHARLTYGEFSRKSKEYMAAISSCEEVLKRKVGFNLSIEEDEEEEEEEAVSDVSKIFMNSKLENTIKCYQFASDDTEKKVYRHFLHIFHSSTFAQYFEEQERRLPVTLNQEEMAHLLETLTKFLTTRNEDEARLINIFYFLAQFNLGMASKLSITQVRELMMNILEKEKDDPGNHKLLAYLNITGMMFAAEIERTTKPTKENSSNFKGEFLGRISKVLLKEQSLYMGYKIEEQASRYSSRHLLSFEPCEREINIEMCLRWIRNMILLTKPNQLERNIQLFIEVVDLLKTYSYFINAFHSKYISYELHDKVNLCLQIIFHFIAGLSNKNAFINYLIERQIWNDLNLIISLDDGWARNVDELSDGQKDTFAKALRNQLRVSSRLYLTQAEQLYTSSKSFYGALIPQSYYPLLPMKSLYGQVKANVIAILKEFKHYSHEIKQQLFSRLDNHAIDLNICEVYNKHNSLFSKYDIPSVEINIDYRDNDQWQEVAYNMRLENGVDLTSVKMEMEDTAGNSELKMEYNNLRLESMSSKKIQSALSTLFAFVRDFFLLFAACFLDLCRKSKNADKAAGNIDEKKMKEVLSFFLNKLGRVEVCGASEGQLLVVDFMVRPECAPNKDVNKKFIESINFVSMQLKLQSIFWQAGRFLLYYQNQIEFYRTFNRVNLMTFLTKNFDMITYVNFAIIVAQNIVLIANSNSSQEYFVDTSLDEPFVWLQIISTAIAGLIMLAYCIKDVPLLIENVNFRLKIRSESYGSNFNNYNPLVKIAIKSWMVFIDPTFAYHLIYSIIVGLVFYNKLFAALLLLDIFFQIPNLKNLLMSIWRPKIELILAIVSFILVQYFFSIFMFFNFKKQTYGYCSTLGKCFGFVFVTTYKAVGGFVGFLFLRSGAKVPSVDFFEVFQDVYVVLIYQIFFALILAIIIDTFSLIRNEQTVRRDYLNSCCIVCNLDKTRFNSAKVNFRAHIAITHNIWNYFYYYEYIKHKQAHKRAPYERAIFLSPNANWMPANISKDIDDEP